MTIKDAKRNFVIETATDLFLERSLHAVTIKDVAKASGLGEATIYRYFSGRGELVVACALKLQEKAERVFTERDLSDDGFRRIAKFYGAYLETFEKRPELYRFLSEFDAFCISEGALDLEEYADNMDKFFDAFISAYRDGIEDGSVRRIDDVELFYYSTAHAVLSLCKKLALEGGLLRQDSRTDGKAEIGLLIDVILSFLSARN